MFSGIRCAAPEILNGMATVSAPRWDGIYRYRETCDARSERLFQVQDVVADVGKCQGRKESKGEARSDVV